MKFFFIFFILGFTGVAQTPENLLTENLNNLIESKIKWNSVSRNDFSPAEKKIIVSFIKDPANSFCTDFLIDGDFLPDFHLIDLDGDKDLDVIYEGYQCPGYSFKQILIYMNKGNAYQNVLNTVGRFVSLNQASDLTIYRYPCCSMIENTMINYRIKQDSLIENFGLNFFYSAALSVFSKDYDLIIPKKLKAGNKYAVKANTGMNYVPKDSLESPMFIKQSLAGFINAEVIVTSYASVTDKKGIQWFYCKVPNGVIVLNNNNAFEYPLMIWIKQRDCINP
jgi:hypothetical protein